MDRFMKRSKFLKCFITNIAVTKKEIEIWCQTDTKVSSRLETSLDLVHNKLSDLFAINSLNLRPVPTPEVGQNYLTHMKNDLHFHRVVVTHVDSSRAFVLFIDFGVEDWVPFNHLVEFDELFEVEPLAQKYFLSDIQTNDKEWNSEEVRRCIQPFLMSIFQCEVISVNKNTECIRVYDQFFNQTLVQSLVKHCNGFLSYPSYGKEIFEAIDLSIDKRDQNKGIDRNLTQINGINGIGNKQRTQLKSITSESFPKENVEEERVKEELVSNKENVCPTAPKIEINGNFHQLAKEMQNPEKDIQKKFSPKESQQEIKGSKESLDLSKTVEVKDNEIKANECLNISAVNDDNKTENSVEPITTSGLEVSHPIETISEIAVEDSRKSDDNTDDSKAIDNEVNSKTIVKEESSQQNVEEVNSKPNTEEVIPKTTAGQVISKTNGEEMVLKTTAEEVISKSNGEEVILKTTAEEVILKTTAEEEIPKITAEEVIPKTTAEEVIPKTTAEEVIPKTTAEEVIPKTTAEEVIPKTTAEEVIPKTTTEEVTPKTSGKEVISKINGEEINSKPDIEVNSQPNVDKCKSNVDEIDSQLLVKEVNGIEGNGNDISTLDQMNDKSGGDSSQKCLNVEMDPKQGAKEESMDLCPNRELIGKKHSLYLTAAVINDKFYGQLTSQFDVIQSLTEKMTAFYNKIHTSEELSLKLDSIKINDIIAARFSGDSLWYRASVKANTGTRLHLIYVDFGNEETVVIKDCKQLSEGFAIKDLKPQAFLLQAIGEKLSNETLENYINDMREVEVLFNSFEDNYFMVKILSVK